MKRLLIVTLALFCINQAGFAQSTFEKLLGPGAFINCAKDPGVSEFIDYVKKEWSLDDETIKLFPREYEMESRLLKKTAMAKVHLDLGNTESSLKVKEFKKGKIELAYSFNSKNAKATTEQVTWWTEYLLKIGFKKTSVKPKVSLWTLGNVSCEIDESQRNKKEYPSVYMTVWNK